jgi:two-component system chemotaxis sensor kinase CheA
MSIRKDVEETNNILKVLVVGVKNRYYAIDILRITSIEVENRENIQQKHNSESILIRGDVVPLFYLSEIFNLNTENTKPNPVTIIIAKSNNNVIGIVVDSVKTEVDAVIKPLGPCVNKAELFNGVAVLQNEGLALMLEPNALT